MSIMQDDLDLAVQSEAECIIIQVSERAQGLHCIIL